MPNVRLIRHETVPKCGSFEVRFADGRESKYFYWDDLPSPTHAAQQLTGEQALEQANAFARAEHDRWQSR